METTTRLREATIADVPAIFAIRVSVRENSATMENLYKHGIDEQMVAGAITASGRGWIVEEGGRAVGFSIADQLEGSVFALFVRPESEGRGYGGSLLDAAVQWLFAKGFDCVWLAVGRNTRAHRFYLRRGWLETGDAEPNGDIELELCRRFPVNPQQAGD